MGTMTDSGLASLQIPHRLLHDNQVEAVLRLIVHMIERAESKAATRAGDKR